MNVTAARRRPRLLGSRLDRLTEGRFAIVALSPGLILVGLVVLPPVLAVLGLSLFRIELIRDDLRPFVGLSNFLNRLPADTTFVGTIPRTILFAAAATALSVPVALGAALLVNGRGRSCEPARPAPAPAVGRRTDRGRPLLALRLRHAVRARERRAPRARSHARPLDEPGAPDARRHARRHGLALDAAPGRAAPRCAPVRAAVAGPCGAHGRRVVMADPPPHHAAGDPADPDRGRRDPAGPVAPGLRHPVRDRPGQSAARRDADDVRDLRLGDRFAELRLRIGADRGAGRAHRALSRAPGARGSLVGATGPGRRRRRRGEQDATLLSAAPPTSVVRPAPGSRRTPVAERERVAGGRHPRSSAAVPAGPSRPSIRSRDWESSCSLRGSSAPSSGSSSPAHSPSAPSAPSRPP